MMTFSPVAVIVDIIYSFGRMIIALVISVAFSLGIGIMAARNKTAESIIIPVLDVFQSIPILGFFPIVILAIIAVAPSQIGVNTAVIVLIFTSMSWNITFGVYEAVKAIPQDYIDLFATERSTTWRKITALYIPASLSRIAYNSQISWFVGLFYLISSEFLSLGNQSYTVDKGIGVAIMEFALSNDWTGYAYAIIMLLAASTIWQVVFLQRFSLWSERYKFVDEPSATKKDPLLRFYSWVNDKSVSKLFLIAHSKASPRLSASRVGVSVHSPVVGVSRFTSTLSRFKTGVKYSALLLTIIFALFELAAILRSGSLHLNSLPLLSTVIRIEETAIIALGVSFARLWYVYFICVSIGLPLGIIIALNQKLLSITTSVLDVVASVPAPALLPIIVVLALGNSELVAAFVIFVGMIWYIIFNVVAGVRTIPAELFELKDIFHISRVQAWLSIYLPSAATAFVTGSITAIGAGWNTLIVAEYFSVANGAPIIQVGTGLGKMIAVATNQGDILSLTLAVLTMTAFIVIFDLGFWRRIYHFATNRYSYNR